MIVLKELNNKSEIIEFVKFPFRLFKGNPNWVPPLINEEVNGFLKEKNPVLENCDVRLFIAYKNNKIAGRIAIIINWDEVNILHKKKVRFGWFDVIDDIEVTKLMLDKALEIAKENQLENIEGPLGFSNLDKVGCLTEGFEHQSLMISWYSMPYYQEHLNKLGFQAEKKFIESYFDFKNVDGSNFNRMAEIVSKKNNLTLKSFKKTTDVLPYVDQMFQLFNDTYSKLESFVPVTEKQIEYYKKKYISFINPEYILFIFDENDKMISFSIVMPNFADALIKAKGKLFPFGFYHLLKAKKTRKDVVFYLIGVLPEYQSKGVTIMIFNEYYNVFTNKGIEKCIRTPELEDNHAIHNLWKHFNPITHKKRATFIKHL